MAMSPEAEALLRAAKNHPETPSAAARARMKQRVLGAAAFGATAAATGTAAGGAAASTGAVLWKIAGGIALVSGLATVTVAAISSRGAPSAQVASSAIVGAANSNPSKPTPQASASAPAPATAFAEGSALSPARVGTSSAVARTALSSSERPALVASPAASSSVGVSASSSSEPDPLVAEVELLRRAQAAFGRGDAAGALALADEHATRFPRGQLSLERRVLRALALCALGRKDEGRVEAAPILEKGSTPAAKRVREACGSP
ncbi:MAG: hypothetical protein U0271_46640 [Polyangiaceae bacterium]